MSTNRTRPDAGWTDGKRQPACRYCGGPLPRGRRSFCSGHRTKHGHGMVVLSEGSGCVHEFLLRSDAGYLRKAVRDRDHALCALCGVTDREDWQADHTVPVVEGGGECGLDGMRTLCGACHKQETAKLRARLAERRRAAAAVAQEAGE